MFYKMSNLSNFPFSIGCLIHWYNYLFLNNKVKGCSLNVLLFTVVCGGGCGGAVVVVIVV